jgi:hypothetical protein
MKLGVIAALMLGTWTLVVVGRGDGGAVAPGNPAVRTPVLVELFTSEGCSSCPPADAVLAELARSQPVAGALVIPLSEHVDYWNHLGWADPYSSKRFSERQGAYAAAFGSSGVYTPQVVVDGRVELVGSDQRAVQRAIGSAAREPKLEITVSPGPTPSSLRVRVEPATAFRKAAGANILLAIVEDDLQSQVSRGENSGRRLFHTAVVRRLQVVGVLPAGKAFEKEIVVAPDPSWKHEHLRAVAFVQEGPSGKILGAGQGAL